MKSGIIERIQSINSWVRFLSSNEKKYVGSVVEMLSEDARVIVYLRYWREFEFSEIAKAIKMKQNEVIFVHSKALQILKAIFENAALKNMAV